MNCTSNTPRTTCAFKSKGATASETCWHGPNIYKDTEYEMSSLLGFNRVYRPKIQSVMLVFRPLL
jgi:hypothetical protein